MRISPLRFALPALLAATSAAAAPPASYDGRWGSTAKACRDPEGVNQLRIKQGDFAWYETYCRTRSVAAGPAGTWKLGLACEGEGQRFTAKPRLVLASPDRLVLYDSPVMPTKRQTYVRCARSVPGRQSGRR